MLIQTGLYAGVGIFAQGFDLRFVRGYQEATVKRPVRPPEISDEYYGHFALLFVRRLYGYFHVLAQGCEEVEKPPDREITGSIAGQR